jgi:cyclopropane-fatty-acyl-phospholipid synthase
MTNVAIATNAPRDKRTGFLVNAARRAVLSRLSGIEGGEIRLFDRATGLTHRAGAPSDLAARIVIEDPRTYVQIATGGTLGAAEAFLRGWWTADDLTAALRIFVRGLATTDGLERDASWWWQAFARVGHAVRRNSRIGSRRNISDHYDLGNGFFRLVLDETMTYSCGVFPRPGASLREASEMKFARLCAKLDLRPDDHLLEIGTGWGSCAIHAARHHGCRVTTTTISANQAAVARERVRAAGLDDRVEVLLCDYRDLQGKYDRLISIEMIEAVGHAYLPAYFATCARLLEDDGLMAVQAITMPDHRYERSRREVDFIQRYVFPGSCVPSMAAMLGAMAKGSDLRVVDADDITNHYVPTLQGWRTNFLENLDEIRELGYDERFVRMWTYYLAYCEAGFAERYIGTMHMVLARPRADWSGPASDA